MTMSTVETSASPSNTEARRKGSEELRLWTFSRYCAAKTVEHTLNRRRYVCDSGSATAHLIQTNSALELDIPQMSQEQ
ncbi:hypothetical protein BST61_g3337 [Cercospora zeina]